MIGKNPDYYENILLETNSVRIVHHYKNKSTLEISYSKLCIQKILSLKDWDKIFLDEVVEAWRLCRPLA
ncbi:hypothetical protein QJS10_CPB18g00990 [Acorus calamus]|uniref:Uncharacterized protein n=1 Tax=Acorus calamus TaxID=4465 RepID=A0AAV9CPP5_ACOCL|nr:hypothetical protein QJS10_CPB18g00990 [Acorus calamus]